MNNYHSGKWAEFLARMYMRCHGYRIVCKNYITGRGTTAGEIDFIACRNNTLVFAEVKKRQTLDTAAYAITPRQQQRIVRGAQSFLQSHPQYKNHTLRFDAILVSLPLSVKHIPNAWEAKSL